MARALSRQQPVVDIRSTTGWSQRKRGPCCVPPRGLASRCPTVVPVPAPVPRRPQPSPVTAGRRLALAVVSGLLLAWAFPTHDHYWLAPVAVAALSAAVLGATWRFAALLGLLSGLAFFLPTLSWSGIYVGSLPWVALSTLQALYIAIS